jgi:hypothetical protein
VIWRKGLDTGDANLVLQLVAKPHPELAKVPLAVSLAKTEEARTLLQAAVHDPNSITRPYSLPRGTPKDRVRILQKAFIDTMKDPEFLADTKNPSWTSTRCHRKRWRKPWQASSNCTRLW